MVVLQREADTPILAERLSAAVQIPPALIASESGTTPTRLRIFQTQLRNLQTKFPPGGSRNPGRDGLKPGFGGLRIDEEGGNLIGARHRTRSSRSLCARFSPVSRGSSNPAQTAAADGLSRDFKMRYACQSVR